MEASERIGMGTPMSLVAGDNEGSTKKRRLEQSDETQPVETAGSFALASPEPGAKRLRLGESEEKQESSSLDEGEIDEGDLMSGLPQGAQEPVSAPSHGGWNKGINSQIRTSLGGRSAFAKLPLPVPAVKLPPQAPAANLPPPPPVAALDGSALTRKEPPQPSQLNKDSWVLPPVLPELQPPKNLETWSDKVKIWGQYFLSRNVNQKHLLTPELLGAYFLEWVDTASNWPKKKREKAHDIVTRMLTGQQTTEMSGITRDVMESAVQSGSTGNPILIGDETSHDTPVTSALVGASTAAGLGSLPPTTLSLSKLKVEQDKPENEVPPSASDWAALLQDDPEKKTGARDTGALITSDGATLNSEVPRKTARAVAIEQEEAAQLAKYFAGTSGASQVCIVCASSGHRPQTCPNLTCRFCEQTDHFAWSCPTRLRCSKCRQLGHAERQCKEKLIMTGDEGLECAFCGSQEHLEENCEQIWRSFRPHPDDVKKVKHISAFCSYCGSEGHYSSDCALRRDRPADLTWSLENRNVYISPTSLDEPISKFAKQAENGATGLHIKGSAAKQTHFYADSDGSEEVEFIGARVQQRAPLGQIRVASNIQFNPSNAPPPPPPRRATRSSRSQNSQPPLPPGPPPPLPPLGQPMYSDMVRNHSASFQPAPRPMPPMPHNTLPPKPPSQAPQSRPPLRQQQLHEMYHNVPPPQMPGLQGPQKPQGKAQNQPGKKKKGHAGNENQAGRRGGRRNKRGGK